MTCYLVKNKHDLTLTFTLCLEVPYTSGFNLLWYSVLYILWRRNSKPLSSIICHFNVAVDPWM